MMPPGAGMANYNELTAISIRDRGPRARLPNVSPQAAFVYKRLPGVAPHELPALAGIQQSALLTYLQELERAGLIDLKWGKTASGEAAAPAAPSSRRPRDIVETRRRVVADKPAEADTVPADLPPIDLTAVARVAAAPAARTVRQEDLPGEAMRTLAELDGPMTPGELISATGLSAERLAVALALLDASDLVYLIREPIGPPQQASAPDAPGGASRVRSAPVARRRLRPVDEAFPPKIWDALTPMPGALVLHRLYAAMRDGATRSFFWRYGDSQAWGLRLVDGYLTAYRTNRDEDAWKVGKLLQQIVGLGDAAIQEALSVQGAASGRLGDLLVERGYLTPDQLRTALALKARDGRLLGDVLVQERLIANELLADVLALQRRSRMRIGELLIDLEYLTPRDLEQALVMQMRWVCRELLLSGPPTLAGCLDEWSFGDEESGKRFVLADWLLKCGRRHRPQIAQAGWTAAWSGIERWVNRPAPSQQLQRAGLTLEERRCFDGYMDARGTPLGGDDAELALICAGLLEPVEAAVAAGPAWLTAADDFQFLGLHWSSLAEEIDAALAARERELAALTDAADVATAVARLQRLRRTLLDENGYRDAIAARHSPADREQAAALLIERGLAALHLRADAAEAQDCADRIQRICWNVAAPLAAGSYIAWGAARQRQHAGDGRRHRARLESLLSAHAQNAEVHYYYALLLSFDGDRGGASKHAKIALSLNPYLKEARKLLG